MRNQPFKNKASKRIYKRVPMPLEEQLQKLYSKALPKQPTRVPNTRSLRIHSSGRPFKEWLIRMRTSKNCVFAIVYWVKHQSIHPMDPHTFSEGNWTLQAYINSLQSPSRKVCGWIHRDSKSAVGSVNNSNNTTLNCQGRSPSNQRHPSQPEVPQASN